MTEDELLRCCMEMAKALGWRCLHIEPARIRKRGVETYRTPVSGDGKGWVDLYLLRDHPEHWECKDETGELNGDQIAWRDALLAASQVWRLVRPADWTSGHVEAWLR